MKYLSIKNLEKYQHYKDRRPPWIKLHAALLDDYEFIQLPDTAKGHLMLLWVLASQMDNKIPHDLAWITQRIGARSAVDVEELILRGWLEPHRDGAQVGKLEGWASRYVSAQTRAALLSAAQHKCAACGSAKNLEIDHIIPISQGGTGDPSNLQVLCRQCNRRKRARLQHAQNGSAEHVRSKSLRSSPASALLETETEAETETDKRRNGAARGDVDRVVTHYLSRHPKRRPGEKDRKLIARHLTTYSPDELCEAIDGNAEDDWAQKTGKHELTWVLRDNGQIDTYRDKAQKALPKLDGNGWFADGAA